MRRPKRTHCKHFYTHSCKQQSIKNKNIWFTIMMFFFISIRNIQRCHWHVYRCFKARTIPRGPLHITLCIYIYSPTVWMSNTSLTPTQCNVCDALLWQSFSLPLSFCPAPVILYIAETHACVLCLLFHSGVENSATTMIESHAIFIMNELINFVPHRTAQRHCSFAIHQRRTANQYHPGIGRTIHHHIHIGVNVSSLAVCANYIFLR